MKKVVTHSSSFHADDVFSAAVVKRMFGEVEIVRTRDPEIIKEADIVFDVGGLYDPASMRFDHHMEGGAGDRSNGIPYAAFGLLWKEFGEQLSGSKEVSDRIDERLVQSIDSVDNGVSTYTVNESNVSPYTIHSVLGIELPTWKEDWSYDEAFFKALPLAEHILDREIKLAQDFYEAQKTIIDVYNSTENKEVIIFDEEHTFAGATIGETLMAYDEPHFYVKYDKPTDSWRAHAIRKESHSFTNRTDFPKEWGGKRDKDLAEISGIEDAVFCHTGLFIAVAKSKESAIEMTQKALN